jgi:hypothetical protein
MINSLTNAIQEQFPGSFSPTFRPGRNTLRSLRRGKNPSSGVSFVRHVLMLSENRSKNTRELIAKNKGDGFCIDFDDLMDEEEVSSANE